MKFTPLVVAGLLAVTGVVCAQTIDPMEPTAPRSRASTLKPPIHVMNAADASNSMAAAQLSQPERPVVPQIAVPFSRGQAGKPELAPYIRHTPTAAETAASSTAALDETAASCEARAGEGMRAVCRDRVARAREQQGSATR